MSISQLTVLIIDQARPGLLLASQVFKKMGFNVVEAATCHEARRFLDENESRELYGLFAVFCDSALPESERLDLLKWMKMTKQCSTARFILLKSLNEPEEVVRLAEAKFDGYILKPLTFARLQLKLQELFPSFAPPKIAS